MDRDSIFWKICLTLLSISLIPTIASGLLVFFLHETKILIPVAFIIFFVIIIAIVFLALILTQSLINPLKTLGDKMREVARGKFETIPKTKRKDELGELAASFNEMIKKFQEIKKR